MKHIISLSLKYIRRQKLRTLLTFLCVTLSVFILCSFSAYIGSILQTAKNQCSIEDGSYEADITGWIEKADDRQKAIDTVRNHIVVSDYYISNFLAVVGNTDRSMNNNKISYFEFSDGKNTKKIDRLMEDSLLGNSDLMGSGYKNFDIVPDSSGVIVPEWLEDMGYSVGDTVTFTLQPVTCEIDEDSEEVKEVRQKLLEEFGTSVVKDDSEYEELDSETRRNAYKGLLMTACCDYYDIDFNRLPVKNKKYGDTVEFSFNIGGFSSDMNRENMFFISSQEVSSNLFGEFYGNPDYRSDSSSSACIRINENIDFDDAMIELYSALGYNKDNYYADLPELNTTLLFYEFRSAGAIADMLPMLLVLFVLMFFAWLVARFVIDNAFEISSQERSSQYAALRIMGASKTQIKALVFTEALFYTFTAVPIGTLSAYLLCRSLFSKFNELGYEYFEYKANPYLLVIGIILCIVAIFISSYTSAMWASRKLSPAEVLNFGKPKKKNKKVRRRKSKINLSSKQFIRRYTNKNIMRSKSRYIIATLTMTLGVMFFTFSLMLGIYAYSELKDFMKNDNVSGIDYSITCNSTDALEDAEKVFYNKELFSHTRIYSNMTMELKEEALKLLDNITVRDDLNEGTYFTVNFVDRNYFNDNLAECTGMTYDEFLQKDGAFLHEPAYSYMNGEKTKDYEESCNLFETPETIEFNFMNSEIKVIGNVCSMSDEMNYSIVVPIESGYADDFYCDLRIEAKVNGQENYAEAKKVYEKFINEHEIYDYFNHYMMSTGLSEFIKSLVKLAASFIMSIWLVGILSMVNSINTSVLNRSRELMMLRSVGMSKKQLRNTVIFESIMFSSVSSSIGTILALVAYFLVMTAIKISPEMFVSMAVGLIASIAVNILISLLASIPALRNLEKAESLVKSF